jgi:hypothetical protein
VREKYCWLAGGWWLVLNWCERKTLLAGWQPASRTRPKIVEAGSKDSKERKQEL